jgi:hypothetical protein
LLDARIVGVTPQAEALGIAAGMTGREAVERMLRATPAAESSAGDADKPLSARNRSAG